ncbi:hypothetical protein O988_05044 [Pseudogymnoascus sp. VKM F-3808]|nr:hypothetical protein O988_05044 [Pseudogymnoascus sp. VKM F-3808]
MANYMELWWYYSYVAGSHEAEKYVAAQDACSAVSYGAVQCSAVRRWKGNGMDLLEALMRLQSRVQHSIGIGIGILAAAPLRYNTHLAWHHLTRRLAILAFSSIL